MGTLARQPTVCRQTSDIFSLLIDQVVRQTSDGKVLPQFGVDEEFLKNVYFQDTKDSGDYQATQPLESDHAEQPQYFLQNSQPDLSGRPAEEIWYEIHRTTGHTQAFPETVEFAEQHERKGFRKQPEPSLADEEFAEQQCLGHSEGLHSPREPLSPPRAVNANRLALPGRMQVQLFLPADIAASRPLQAFSDRNFQHNMYNERKVEPQTLVESDEAEDEPAAPYYYGQQQKFNGSRYTCVDGRQAVPLTQLSERARVSESSGKVHTECYEASDPSWKFPIMNNLVTTVDDEFVDQSADGKSLIESGSSAQPVDQHCTCSDCQQRTLQQSGQTFRRSKPASDRPICKATKVSILRTKPAPRAPARIAPGRNGYARHLESPITPATPAKGPLLFQSDRNSPGNPRNTHPAAHSSPSCGSNDQHLHNANCAHVLVYQQQAGRFPVGQSDWNSSHPLVQPQSSLCEEPGLPQNKRGSRNGSVFGSKSNVTDTGRQLHNAPLALASDPHFGETLSVMQQPERPRGNSSNSLSDAGQVYLPPNHAAPLPCCGPTVVPSCNPMEIQPVHCTSPSMSERLDRIPKPTPVIDGPAVEAQEALVATTQCESSASELDSRKTMMEAMDVKSGNAAAARAERKRKRQLQQQAKIQDEMAEKVQSRMVKNRESAARSRMKKQKYTEELEQENKILKQQIVVMTKTIVNEVAVSLPHRFAKLLDGKPLRRTRTAEQ